jgi:SAM-dependent methyltransferase
MLKARLDREMRRRAAALCETLRPHLEPSATVLDVGAGTGHNGQALLDARVCAKLVTADVVDLRVVGPSPTIFDGEKLPFEDASVDVCLLVHVLQYATDPVRLLRECARVARAGVLVVQSTHEGSGAEMMLRMYEVLWGPLAWGVARAAGWVGPDSFALSARRCLSVRAMRQGLEPRRRTDRPWRVPGVRSDLWHLEPRRKTALRREKPLLSVVIPARNEEHLLGGTLDATLAAAKTLGPAAVEIVVVDNDSTDRTVEVARSRGARVRVISSTRHGAACARNDGARAARGGVLVFVDADTLVPPEALERVVAHCARGDGAGIVALGDRDGGFSARAWWSFWNAVRRLPLARAKAMSAFMFSTREVFDRYGPFDEEVEIGEEWPILAGLYRDAPGKLRYDRSIVCKTSSRRMDLQRLGYLRVSAHYLWAIVHPSGRTGYGDHLRHPRPATTEGLATASPRE